MDVDGREVAVSGNLLQPLARRTSDIIRVVIAALVVLIVIVVSLITRGDWDPLEKSISGIVDFLTPAQSDLVYLIYGIAIFALPFVVLVALLTTRRWRMLWAYAAAAVISFLSLSITENGIAPPRWHFDRGQRLDSVLSQFLDDPRWIAMLAAVLTVSGPWLPAGWRLRWWTLLLAFVPIHLVVSAVVPARAVLGLATGWLVGALVVWVVGTPALAVPLEAMVRTLVRRGIPVERLTVVRLAGASHLLLTAHHGGDAPVIIDLYGPNQRSAGAIRQFWNKIRLRSRETAPLQLSVHRAVEHRGLLALAIDKIQLANATALVVASLDFGWAFYAHTPARGIALDRCAEKVSVVDVWQALHALHDAGITHGDLQAQEITVDAGQVYFGGFRYAQFGATDVAMQSDIASLLATTSSVYGAQSAVAAALSAFGEDAILTASGRLTRSALPRRIQDPLNEPAAVLKAAREEIRKQTGASMIAPETITRFTRNQVIQLVLLVALVYVAYPFISTVPTFFSELRTVNWCWALLGLVVSMMTYVGAAAGLWACANEFVGFGNLTLMQFANTFAATTTPAGVGGLALSTRFLQKAGLGGVRATTAVALQQTVQVIVHVLLLICFTTLAGTSANLSHLVPSTTVLYLIAGLLLGAVGIFLFVPKLRHWLATAVRPKIGEVVTDLAKLAHEPKRLAIIVIGCAATTLGAALALWASVEAFGGDTSFVTVTVVTMIGGTLASAAPTPGGVGAVEAALIGGLAAFGMPSGISVPAVLLYRVLTCWLPVAIGWPVMRWLNRNDMI
ncbi:MAG: lysylphosphatidylglycerol synthase domain-containing protein [Gordonia sp. (in: high G+C Gram-positive bacteria)]